MTKRSMRLKEASLFWNKYNGDSFDEDEEEDLLNGCQTLSKRPKWMTAPYPSSLNMASADAQLPHSSTGNRSPALTVKVPIKKPFHRRLKPEVKENGADVEIVDLSNSGSTSPTETRPPLTNLSVRTKTKQQQFSDVTYPGSSSRPTHVHERRQNGVHPSMMNTFTSSMRMNKSTVSAVPKQTALHEIFKIDEKLKYSQLLADYHKSSTNFKTSSTISETPQQRKVWTQSLSNTTPKSVSSPRLVETIDLTGEEKKRTRIKVKPYQSTVISSDEDEVKILEEMPITRVNSLEKKLSQNCLVSPQWIIEMQQKYSEKERESLRQVEEEKLKKELYAKHNQSRRLEALDARIRNHLKITDIVLDDTEDEQALVELTPEMNEKIKAALRPNPPSEVLVEGFGQRLTRNDIQTLNRLNWLNDEVIHHYIRLKRYRQ
ncbi:uncharacterized protein LOC124364176 isoform X2 [Homalodisca vitripennis]|uniref:uncharacterized protein LOC124364176 isoform X2 n=1 Tax=Homalodisca vitripennis TaxID=197043 RepID=UPI001EE9FD24|nr:uncharacterized protein LOC124364176 isoform X2 [Homalodisca vitripennis]